MEADAKTSNSKDEEEDKSGEDEENTKKEDKKSTVSQVTDAIADNRGIILAFLQDFAAKVPRVAATPLLLRADKHAQ